MLQIIDRPRQNSAEKQSRENAALSGPNPVAEQAMARHLATINRCKIDPEFSYQPGALVEQKIRWFIEHGDNILDIGQSSRDHATLFKPGQRVTTDINQKTASPVDIVDDICAPVRLTKNSYDGIVCLSILEHVYDPFSAADHLHNLLKPGGYLFLHLPFIFRYHADQRLEFTDCYRFSRDGIAWLLKDFSEVTLYPVRGPYSSMFNLQKFWKKGVEKRFGTKPNQWIDRVGQKLFGRPNSDLQVSGYYVWARK